MNVDGKFTDTLGKKFWGLTSSFASMVSMLAATGRPPARWRPVDEKYVPSGWLTVFIASPLIKVKRSYISASEPIAGPST